MDPLTVKESRKRWQTLLDRRAKVKEAFPVVAVTSLENEEDPFDCQGLVIPPTPAIVDNILDDFAYQWKQLDFRKIDAGDDSNAATDKPTNNDNTEEEPPRKKPKKSLWQPRTHLKMPENFDYTTTQQSAPDSSSTGTGIRVMSLLDPTQSSSYETALWELFQQVPPLAEIEQEIQEGVQLPHFTKLVQEIVEGFQATCQMDGHSFSRLRRNARHHALPPPTLTSTNLLAHAQSTVRLEFWRKQPRRSSTIDPDRCVMEFLAHQTLADVHQAIVELNDDPIWNLPLPDDDNNNNSNNNNNSIPAEESPPSGFFFIENQFYSIGPVDYVTPVQKWLQAGFNNNNNTSARLQFLGLTHEALRPPQSMTETRLRDIPWSLGIRYHHAYHGHVDCAVFATDIHHYPMIAANPNYPVVHDVWTPSFVLSSDCEGCQKFPTAVGTSTECAIALGHRSLCPKCSRKLLKGECK